MTETQTTPGAKPSLLSGGRHPVSIGHLVMGLAFLGLVGVWAVIAGDWIDDDDIRWLLPVPWVLAGLGGLVALAVTGARRHSTRANGWVDTPAERAETIEEPYAEPDAEPDPEPDAEPDAGRYEEPGEPRA